MPEHPLLHLERLALHLRCRSVMPLRLQHDCKVHGRPQRVGVLLAEHPLLHLERLAAHRRCRSVLPLGVQRICEMHGHR